LIRVVSDSLISLTGCAYFFLERLLYHTKPPNPAAMVASNITLFGSGVGLIRVLPENAGDAAARIDRITIALFFMVPASFAV
jgi:hypothetical protein